jgi:Photosynthetic reaction centre cytochrome C subunit
MVDDFEDGLGVSCNFCHAEEKGSHRLDYASDAKPEKEIARMMMRMSVQVNKKYFRLKHPMIGDSSLVITCNTCHHGQPHPDNTTADQ